MLFLVRQRKKPSSKENDNYWSDIMVAMTVFRFKLSLCSLWSFVVGSKVKTFRDKMRNIDENVGRRPEDYRTEEYRTSEDNIMSLTESTCISVESLEDGTFYEDDNDEFVATLSEMSDCQAGQNYSDDELLDEYCRENELRYKDNESPAGCSSYVETAG